jgi:hypothetical protein
MKLNVGERKKFVGRYGARLMDIAAMADGSWYVMWFHPRLTMMVKWLSHSNGPIHLEHHEYLSTHFEITQMIEKAIVFCQPSM